LKEGRAKRIEPGYFFQALRFKFGPDFGFGIELVKIIGRVNVLMETSDQVDFFFGSDEGMLGPGTRSDSIFAFNLNPDEFGLVIIEIDGVEITKRTVKNLVASVNVKPE
jgi:hypothetical protein